MSIKLNGATNGSVELDVPDAIGSDLSVTIPATAGDIVVKGTDGSVDLGAIDIAASAPADSVNIDSSGRLLLGTSSALATSAGRQLQVADANGAFLLLGRDDTNVGDGPALGGIHFYGNDTTSNAWTQLGKIDCSTDGIQGAGDNPTKLVFSTTDAGASSPTERMRITSAGDIFFDTADEPNGTTGWGAAFTNESNKRALLKTATTSTASNTLVAFFNPNGTVGNIKTNGSSTSYNTTSDYRLKENIVPLTGAADRLNQLQVHRFNFIADPDTTLDGFLAHEAQAVVPEAVHGTKDEIDADGNPVYQGIDQSKLVPLLTAALQEAIERIETLEASNAALEARQTALEGGAS